MLGSTMKSSRADPSVDSVTILLDMAVSEVTAIGLIGQTPMAAAAAMEGITTLQLPTLLPL
jgi:hypothetical protein